MNDALRDNLNSGNEDPNGLGYTEYCAVCQTRLSPKTMFCPVCDPPSPPDIEPEEQGISFDQALLRIGALLILFLAVAFVKLEFSLDTLFTEQKVGEEIETLTEKERPHDKDFQTVHTVITSLANIRSKPSMDGEIITVAEKGMSLDVIEDNGHWSKVRVFGKTGWISNKIIKTEVQMQE